MNFTTSLLMWMFCGLILAEEEGDAAGTGVTQPYCSDMCNFMRDFASMREKLGAMENQILELKSREQTKVIFSAATGGGNAPIGPFSTDTTVIYRKVFTNIGNAYNKVTGIFAAPVTGVYYFTLFHHSGGQHVTSLSLVKNSEVIVMTYDHPSAHDTADNGGNAVFLELQQGDQVYVRLEANAYVWGNDLVTTFSGFLLSQG